MGESVDDDEKSKYCCSCRYYGEVISDGINRGLKRMLLEVGFMIGRYPVAVIFFNLVFVACFVPGITQYFEQKPMTLMSIPTDSHLLEYEDTIEKYFQASRRTVTLIISADNILSPESIQELLRLDKAIKAIDGNDPRNFSWPQSCYQVLGTCWSRGILELWSFDEDVINNLSQEDILRDVNTISQSPLFGRTIILSEYLGEIRTNGSGYVTSAAATKCEYIIKEVPQDAEVTIAGHLWEAKFIEYMKEFHETFTAFHHVTFNTETSQYIETDKAASFDVILLGIGYIVITIFACIYISRFSWIRNRIFVGLAGILSVGFSMIVTLGLAAYAGYAFTDTHSTIPFLLIGIMVDNMFVMTGSLEIALREGHAHTVAEQIAHTLEHGGLSVMVTSFTDILALGIGASTTLPFISSFCTHVTIGIFGNFLFVLTFFMAFLAIDQRRVAQNRNAIICCVKHEEADKDSVHICRKSNHTLEFIRKYYAPFLNNKVVQAIVIIISLSFLAVFAYGFSKMEYYTEPKWWVGKDSYTYKYLTLKEKYFPVDGIKVEVFLGHHIDYFQDRHILLELCHEIEHDTFTRPGTVACWPEIYMEWLNQSDVYTNYSSQLDPDSHYPTTEANYYDLLQAFMSSDTGMLLSNFLIFDDHGHINASKIILRNIAFEGPAEEIEGMEHLADITHETGYSSHDCFAFAPEYYDFELNEHMDHELEFSIALAAGCVVAMTLVLLASPLMAIYIGLCIAMVLVDVMGAMYFWGMSIDVASAVMVIQSLGFTVDYSVHMSEAFISVGGTRKERKSKSLENMGPAVWYGGLATFMILLPVFGAQSYIYQTFYKVFLLISIFGLFHGLVFLPVLLGWIGPSAYLTVKRKHEKAQEKADANEQHKKSSEALGNGHSAVHPSGESVIVVDDETTVNQNGEYVTQL